MDGPILVSGASGFLGRHLLETNREGGEGTPALALVRDTEAWQQEGWTGALEEVECIEGSVTEPKLWSDEERLKGLKGIFHLAAVVKHSRWQSGDVYETNVEGTLNMVRLAAAEGCRLVFLSTSGTVGCFHSPRNTQTSTPPTASPTCRRGRTTTRSSWQSSGRASSQRSSALSSSFFDRPSC